MFEVPVKETIDLVMQRDFISVDEELTLGEIFADMVLDKKTIIAVDRVNDMVTGYLRLVDMSEVLRQYKDDYKNVKLKNICKKDFIMIDTNYKFYSYSRLLDKEKYLYRSEEHT